MLIKTNNKMKNYLNKLIDEKGLDKEIKLRLRVNQVQTLFLWVWCASIFVRCLILSKEKLN